MRFKQNIPQSNFAELTRKLEEVIPQSNKSLYLNIKKYYNKWVITNPNNKSAFDNIRNIIEDHIPKPKEEWEFRVYSFLYQTKLKNIRHMNCLELYYDWLIETGHSKSTSILYKGKISKYFFNNPKRVSSNSITFIQIEEYLEHIKLDISIGSWKQVRTALRKFYLFCSPNRLQKKTVVNLAGEKWKHIHHTDFKEYYMVSNMGRVKSLNSSDILYAENLLKKRVLGKTNNMGNGCAAVSISNKKLATTAYVNNLVAHAFLKKPKGYESMKVISIDGDAFNNKQNNLKWVTQSYLSSLNFKKYPENRNNLYNANVELGRCLPVEKAALISKMIHEGRHPSYIAIKAEVPLSAVMYRLSKK